jgi:hypothetical protein
MSLTGSCFSSESTPGSFHHGIRGRGGTIFWAALPSIEWQVKRTCELTSSIVPRGTSFHRSVELMAGSQVSISLAIPGQRARRSRRGLPRRPVVNGNIFNSKGVLVGIVVGQEIFDTTGKKLFDLRGVNIYRLSGELVGHLSDKRGSEKRLDRSTDRLFPT